MTRFAEVRLVDVRFPTSSMLDGSDAMNPSPDYSAAYVELVTDDPGHPSGHGFAFTIGRGNDVQLAAIGQLREHIVGRAVDEVLGDLGAFSRSVTWDSPLRWLGPEKGIMQMAIGAVVNAMWDLAGKRAGKPVWQLLAEMSPEQLVSLVDWRYLDDALTPDGALALLRDAEPGRASRRAELLSHGVPAYTTGAGWLGYGDEKVVDLCRAAVADGFDLIKLKVGRDIDDDVRRLKSVRAAVGPDVRIAVDANQVWSVPEAIAWIGTLAEFDLHWVEEPTSPDDILGHAAIRRAVAPVKIATGEHVANRVVFKQLLQADALDVVQIDACRVAGVNENVAILLLAAAFGVPVCPHAGGVGLCEAVQHLAMFDFVAVAGVQPERRIEYVDHLHDHFVDPVRLERARYRAPLTPGMSTEMHAASQRRYRYPDGAAWSASGA